jgi:leucyl-tRNA synthetase
VGKEAAEIFLKLLHPFCPHITEELWKKIGNKPFISKEKWPKFDESKIDLEAEMGEELVKKVLDDIEEIKKITGIEKPKKIRIFVSPEWKYDVWRGVKEDKEVGDFMKEGKYKKIGKELVNYVQSLMKKRPTGKILNFEREMKILKEGKDLLEKETEANVDIIDAKKTDEKKAKQAEPMKPGIIIE